MGKKGDKLTEDSVLTANLMLEKLSIIEGITIKKMFGGHGVFHNDKMFAIVDSKGSSFLKTNEETKVDFEDLGSIKHSRMPYYSIPNAVLEDVENLVLWASKAIAINN